MIANEAQIPVGGEVRMKLGSGMAIALALAIAVAPTKADVLAYDPGMGFITAENAIACINSGSIRQAEVAVRVNDPEWLKSVECVTTPGGLRVQPIYAPWNVRNIGDDIWQVRLVGPDSKPIGVVFLRSRHVLTWFSGGVHRTLAAAQAAQAALLKEFKTAQRGEWVNRFFIYEQGGEWRLWIGPHEDVDLYLACSSLWNRRTKLTCERVYRLPAG